MSIKPQCFGWVNASAEKLEIANKILGDCKNCPHLTPCIVEYDYWEYGHPELEMEPHDDESDEEEDDELGGLCGEWFSPGVEDCEFCPHSELCQELTYQSQKAQRLFKPSSLEGKKD